MKFALSKTVLTAWEEKIPSGNYRGLHVRLAGTANTGQTLAKGDVGNFTLNLNGEQIAFMPDVWLSDLNNQDKGYNEFASASGGAFTYGLFIPFEIPGFPNALNVAPDDALYLGYQPAAAVATKVSSWTIDVNTVETGEVEKYVPRFLPFNQSIAAAAVVKYRVPNKNVFKLWLSGSNISRVMMERDGELLHEAAYASLLSLTSYDNRVEAALASYISFKIGDQVSDLLNSQVDIQITATGASTPLIQYCSIGASAERKRRAVERRQTNVVRRLQPIQAERPDTYAAVLDVEKVS